MPLLDHFHPPPLPERRWQSFHAYWIPELGGSLNRLLPREYYAEAQINLGGRVEVDIATLERLERAEPTRLPEGGNGGVATLVDEVWAPPAPPMTWPGVFPDEFEVLVFSESGGAQLVGVIELVSPANKDRPETRRAFASKCASYLHEGVGLIVVDIVTSRLANLHDEMVGLLDLPDRYRFPEGGPLYAVAYRPSRSDPGGDRVDAWPVPLAVGGPLPVLPLGLRNGPILPVDLDATYAEARARSRL